jgi:hypothetical protein
MDWISRCSQILGVVRPKEDEIVVRVLSRGLEALEGEGRSHKPSFQQRGTHDGSLEGPQQCAFPSTIRGRQADE